jgi:ABC-type uncharacterized transport system permease subunit
VAINLRTFKDGEAAPPARPLTVSRARTSRRILLDRVSSRVVVLGGIVIIASILAILLVIAAEVYPLFVKPTATFVRAYPPAASSAPAAGESIGVDEYREVAFVVTGRAPWRSRRSTASGGSRLSRCPRSTPLR